MSKRREKKRTRFLGPWIRAWHDGIAEHVHIGRDKVVASAKLGSPDGGGSCVALIFRTPTTWVDMRPARGKFAGDAMLAGPR